jgi:hypothetical protein
MKEGSRPGARYDAWFLGEPALATRFGVPPLERPGRGDGVVVIRDGYAMDT